MLLTCGSVAFADPSSDWYVRAAGGAIWGQDADFSDEDPTSVSPPALFGSAVGSDGRALGAYGDFGEYLILEMAAGRILLPWVRMDLALGYRPNMKYSGTANFLGVPGAQPVSTTARCLSLMANLFVEPATALGISTGCWRPYVGAGLGVSYNRLKNVTYRFPEAAKHTISITPSGDRFDPAFMLTCGLGITLSQKWILDLSGRYEDLGQVGTDVGNMYMNHFPQGIRIAETEADLRGFGFLAGVRYLF